jgi:hypothetical protein
MMPAQHRTAASRKKARKMTTSWVLDTVGLLATTVAALLIFLHMRSLPSSVEELQTPEGRRLYLRNQRRTTLAVGLLAVWLLLQYLAVILL